MNDLSVVVSQFDDQNVRFPAALDDAGVPRYALTKPEHLGTTGGHSASSGGNQSLAEPGGWTINTNASKPFSPYSLGGWIQGQAGPMFCINGNMDVTDVSLHDENSWPSITQTADGKVFLVDGGRTSLVRVDGLETLSRLPEQTITVTTDDLQRARDWFAQTESRRQQQRGSGILSVPLRRAAPRVDGQLNDWPATTDWAFIDRRGTKANFNSNSRPYEVSAAVALIDTHLYAAWRTTEKDLLNNSGETANPPFKHGGCLDVMLATDPAAAPDRNAPVPGDQRLLITEIEGKTLALLYRAKVPGTKQPVAFSSPWRTITIDVVEDVSEHVTLATDKQGSFEISVPLAALHWQPKPGEIYRADLGVLRGANVGDVFMSLIYTCELCGANPFDYLTELERHAGELASHPQHWMPWNYRLTLDGTTPPPDTAR